MARLDLIRRPKAENSCTACECGGFMTEFGEEIHSFDNHIKKGVMLDAAGSRLKLKYDGLLAKSGAQDVYAVVSYGDNKHWDNIRYYHMNNTGRGGFEVVLPVNVNMNVNVVFKDGLNNWDNNSGKNYSFNAH